MSSRTAITVHRPPDDVEGLWRSAEHRPATADADVSFKRAPGGRGTEIHVTVEQPGLVGQAVGKVTGNEPLAEVKDELRRFKQVVETGEVPRSDGSPEGEQVERKLKQRPAQPMAQDELEKAGAR